MTCKKPTKIKLLIKKTISFGLNHPSVETYGNMDKTNKESLISIMENQQNLKNKEKNKMMPKIDLKKQIYGYIFVYDVMEPNTLTYVKILAFFVNLSIFLVEKIHRTY